MQGVGSKRYVVPTGKVGSDVRQLVFTHLSTIIPGQACKLESSTVQFTIPFESISDGTLNWVIDLILDLEVEVSTV